MSDVAGSGRAFSRRTLHTRSGELIASMAQEQWAPFRDAAATG